ncbi:MAG TPA: DNA alkylation repair protein [Bacteroidales bacterium]|jgi:3-methyladenine DNA glycosylase AlkD/HD superfamily phosphodiesterase|nr:DNA alkylation repair protein [Bacteroidales bacterium]
MNDFLKQYIEEKILPRYDSFDAAHQRDHALKVIAQSAELAKHYDVNADMVYVIAAYHDLGLEVDRETHHIESARIIREDKTLQKWFSPKQIEIMAEAAEDHRASNEHEPCSIYGKIIAEADRDIDGPTIIRRTIQYGLKHYPTLDKEGHFERFLDHMANKYAEGGYLKLWIPESPNAAKLKEFQTLLKNPGTIQKLFNQEWEIQRIINEIKSYIDPEKARILPRFFKTGKGEYGEGDRFMGVTVPNIRKVAKSNKDVSLDLVAKLLQSEWHEVRMCAVLLLVEKFKQQEEAVLEVYLRNTARINNWDLVDLSAPQIVGGYLLDKSDRSLLYRLAKSESLWERRIAIVSTLHFIRNGQFEDTIAISEMLLEDSHDLIRKATGWMLREMGKRDLSLLRLFLTKHSGTMSCTTLRYAIEKMDPEERKFWLNKRD